MTNDEQDSGKKDAARGAADGGAKPPKNARPPKRISDGDRLKEGAAPDPESDEPRARRRLPYALFALLALVGVGLYVAWPALQERIATPSFEPDAEVTEPALSTDHEDALPEVPSAIEAETDSGLTLSDTVAIDEIPTAREPEGRDNTVADGADGAEGAGAANGANAGLFDDTALAALEARLAEIERAVADAALPIFDTAPLDELGSRLDERLDALEATLGALPSRGPSDAGTALRLDALEALLAEAPDAMPALNAANLRLNRLDARIAALAEQAAQPAAWESALGAATARLNELEAALSRETGDEARLVALIFAAGRLNTALARPTPFARELGALGVLAGDDAALSGALATLRPMAARGVQTLEGLRGGFPETASAVVRASAVPEDASWVDETVAKLSQIVTVRRTDATLNPESRDGRLLRADQALRAGDLGAALDAMEGFPGDAAAAWLAAARARLAADAALDAIDAHVLALVEERWPASAD